MKKTGIFILIMSVVFGLCACGKTDTGQQDSLTGSGSAPDSAVQQDMADTPEENSVEGDMADDGRAGENGIQIDPASVSDGFVLIPGGTFQMGSPEEEPWRSEDETQHTVTVSDFYMGIYELTQAEYQEIMGENPSSFSGDELPVENVSWLDAIRFCNARSEKEGLTPVYTIEGTNITWNRAADGYRLPTEAEWEYACRGGTVTPFNTENSISADEANYYGHYPYEIEDNYFSQGNLTTKPGEYRQTTVAVDSFSPNAWGLYNMHGNVGEWVWDYYGAYGTEEQTDPAGAQSGTLRVYRGGGWNDFAKNMRSAYRATLAEDKGSFNIGIRLVRGTAGSEVIAGAGMQNEEEGNGNGNVLVAYFSWGGNTRGIAEEIQAQTGADLFEIELVNPYSDDYNTVLDEAQRDQNEQARPELAVHVENMEDYDTIILGYPIWWGEAPRIVSTFVESYDFSGKTIVPFCTSGGSGVGSSAANLEELTSDAVWLPGKRLNGGDSQETVMEWVNGMELGLSE